MTARGGKLALGVALWAALALFGCKDEGRERYLSARARYLELVEQQKHPSSPEFDEVRARLQSVPKDSASHAEAQKLLAAIDKARSLPARPLATSGGGTPTEQACEELARQLGLADGGQRERLAEALAQCRKQLEREKATSHPEDDGHTH